MRNLFDQYVHPENRLTHALGTCLNEDRQLLNAFLRWIGVTAPRGARLIVEEQTLPGEAVPQSDRLANTGHQEADERGLPDLVIHNNIDWCVIVESKIQAPLEKRQLAAHRATLERRDFKQIHLVALTKNDVPSFNDVIWRSWADLYEWLGGSQLEWPSRLRDYLRVSESRLAEEGYLKEGTLTMFDGFPFSATVSHRSGSRTTPYNYREAKRLLNLAMATLREDTRLESLGADLGAPGRARIKGSKDRWVWDFIPLRSDSMTSDGALPNFQLLVGEEGIRVGLTLPNKMPRRLRNRLGALGTQGLAALHRRLLQNGRKLTSRGAWYEARAGQRHFPSRAARRVIDAELSFDLNTSIPNCTGRRTKHCDYWSAALLSLFQVNRQQANVLFEYNVVMPWDASKLNLASRHSLDCVVQAWHSFQPLQDIVREQ